MHVQHNSEYFNYRNIAVIILPFLHLLKDTTFFYYAYNLNIFKPKKVQYMFEKKMNDKK